MINQTNLSYIGMFLAFILGIFVGMCLLVILVQLFSMSTTDRRVQEWRESVPRTDFNARSPYDEAGVRLANRKWA